MVMVVEDHVGGTCFYSISMSLHELSAIPAMIRGVGGSSEELFDDTVMI